MFCKQSYHSVYFFGSIFSSCTYYLSCRLISWQNSCDNDGPSHLLPILTACSLDSQDSSEILSVTSKGAVRRASIIHHHARHLKLISTSIWLSFPTLIPVFKQLLSLGSYIKDGVQKPISLIRVT